MAKAHKDAHKPAIHEPEADESQEQHVAAEEQSQDQPEGFSLNGQGKVSQADMVRDAIKNGHDMPKDGVVHIKRVFGFEMKGVAFSAAKSQIESADKKKAAKAEGREVPSQSAKAPYKHPADEAFTNGPGAVALPRSFGDDIISIRDLLRDHENDSAKLKDHVNLIVKLHQTYGGNLTKMIDGFA